jgi:PAS domain S-box-containing protein
MSIISLIPPFTRGRRRNFNLQETEALLELLPQTAILLDFTSNKILIANAEAAELTAFTRSELVNLTIGDLLPGLIEEFQNTKDGSLQNEIPSKILKRNNLYEEVLVTISVLDEAGSYAVATIDPLSLIQEKQSEFDRLESRLSNLLSLSQTTQGLNVHSALSQLLEIGKELTDASIQALYLANPKKPGLVLRFSKGQKNEFPIQLPPQEIEDLNEPTLWLLGKRVTNVLQKNARKYDYTYLASSPVGKPDAITGLYVIADDKLNPSSDVLSLLLILASTISTIIQHHALVANSKKSRKNDQITKKINNLIVENIQEGIIVLNNDLKILEMNSPAEWMLGYAGREIQNQPIENVIIGAENLVSALQVAQEGISTPNLGNIRLHRRDGSEFLSHIHIEPMMVDDNFDGVIILLRDLSEREQIEERNQQLEQRAILGEVTSIFAHEVRNPLNNLSTGLQLMARNIQDEDPNQELIEQSQEDLRRITHLIESTLEFARAKETKMETVDAADLIDRILKRWHPRFARLNVIPQFEVHDENPVLFADPRALEQVLSNLIGNALDAMSEDGGILGINVRKVNVHEGRDQIEISISDTGSGIPEDDLTRIFEPFYTTKNQKGTGLGLAIAKRIVTRHNGTISINSVPGGSVFLVNLPAYENQRANN